MIINLACFVETSLDNMYSSKAIIVKIVHIIKMRYEDKTESSKHYKKDICGK